MSSSFLAAKTAMLADNITRFDISDEDMVADLIYAARAGDVDELRAALSSGALVDGQDGNGSTALMMAAANGHVDAMQALLAAGADVNAVNERKNTALHWAVMTKKIQAVEALLAARCDIFLRNDRGLTPAMDAERSAQGELVVLILNSLDGDEDSAAEALGHGEEDNEDEITQLAQPAGVDKTLDSAEGASLLKTMQQAPAGEATALPASRGFFSAETLGGSGGASTGTSETAAAAAEERWAVDDVRVVGLVEEAAVFNGAIGTLTGKVKASDAGERLQVRLTRGEFSGKKPYLLPENIEYLHSSQRGPKKKVDGGDDDDDNDAALATALTIRERPMDDPRIQQRLQSSAARRSGDWRYSLLPGVVPFETMLQLSRDFFETTQLLTAPGNTFGAEFEAQYAGRRNYFYYVNRNRVVPGAEVAAFIFEELDKYTRQVVELHHPGVPVRLERAFGAYYEGGREGFHRGVNEHCDGDANLVSTVVHAVLPGGDAGFSEGGELTISAIEGEEELPAAAITHSNETIGSVVYLGGSVFHHASPIGHGGRRLVFCMFYACEESRDLSKHALAS